MVEIAGEVKYVKSGGELRAAVPLSVDGTPVDIVAVMIPDRAPRFAGFAALDWLVEIKKRTHRIASRIDHFVVYRYDEGYRYTPAIPYDHPRGWNFTPSESVFESYRAYQCEQELPHMQRAAARAEREAREAQAAREIRAANAGARAPEGRESSAARALRTRHMHQTLARLMWWKDSEPAPYLVEYSNTHLMPFSSDVDEAMQADAAASATPQTDKMFLLAMDE